MRKSLALGALLLALCLSVVRADASQTTAKYVLTSSSATACTEIAPSASAITGVLNASTSAQTVTLSLYDEGASPSCASADLIYSVVLTASQVVTFPRVVAGTSGYLGSGLAYKLSAAATNNIVILYQAVQF